MTEHIPLFIIRASNENDPLQKEAFQALYQIGAWTVVPYILQTLKEDDTHDDLAFDLLSAEGAWFFSRDNAEYEGMLQELFAHAEDHMDVALYILQNPLKEWWDVAMQIIRAIGYPRNAPAIPIVILHASDWNSVAQQTAFHVLQDMGPVVVAQYLIPILSGKQQGVGQWLYSIYALCLLLNDLGTSNSTLCAPTILYMMRQNEFAQKVEIETGLTVLKKIGPDSVAYALPTLIDLVSREGTSDVGRQAQRLIQSFGKEALEPYKFLLESIAEKPKQ
ncbi:MAG: hypothetical protein ACYDER_03635 [Ktedonobacteraceae bacterium]